MTHKELFQKLASWLAHSDAEHRYRESYSAAKSAGLKINDVIPDYPKPAPNEALIRKDKIN